MKILCGISGVGLGHAVRAKELISYLEKKNHEVLIFTDDEAYYFLKDQFNIFKIKGIPLYFKNNSLSIKKSLSGGIKSIITNIKNSNKIRKKIKEFKPDICITDMEPFTSFISSIYKIPLVSITNQHSLIHSKMNIPKQYKKGSIMANFVIKLVSPNAKKYLILSFSKNSHMYSKNSKYKIINPIIRSEVLNLKSTESNFILVYQTRLNNNLIEILKQIPENFVVYSYDKEYKEKNITYKKISNSFINDLKKAKAVIGTSGFSLISETLFLKKPYFAIPLKKHYEQVYNSFFLKHNNFGQFSLNPNKEEILSFIRNLNKYKNSLNNYNFNQKNELKIIEKTLEEIKES